MAQSALMPILLFKVAYSQVSGTPLRTGLSPIEDKTCAEDKAGNLFIQLSSRLSLRSFSFLPAMEK